MSRGPKYPAPSGGKSGKPDRNPRKSSRSEEGSRPRRPEDRAPRRPEDRAPRRPEDRAPRRPEDRAPRADRGPVRAARPAESPAHAEAPAAPRRSGSKAPRRSGFKPKAAPEPDYQPRPYKAKDTEIQARFAKAEVRPDNRPPQRIEEPDDDLPPAFVGDIQRIFGKHPVREALSSDRPVYKIWIAQGLTPAVLREFERLAKDRDVPVQIVPHNKLNQLLAHVESPNHQGLVAEIGAYDYADWDTWLTGLKQQDRDPFVIVLDQVQDPHNLGAILRTAEAAGVHGVVIPKHGGVGLSETVAKASAGAIETMPVLQVTNLARALEELKAAGLWIMGLSANEGQNHFKTDLKGPIALVIGSEHKGLRPNSEKHCDRLLIIPMLSDRSLNASVAAAVAMYEVVRQRQAE